MVLHTHSFLHATDRHHLLPSFCGMWAREHVDEPKYCFTPQEGSLTSHTLMQRVWLVRLTRGLVSFLRLSFWTAGVAECALPRPYIHILCMARTAWLGKKWSTSPWACSKATHPHVKMHCVIFMSASLPVLSVYTANLGAGLLYSCVQMLPPC